MLNFAVGPVMMDEEILNIGSNQIPYFRTNEFSTLMKENEKMLLKCVNAPFSSKGIFLTGSGTAAMEATIMNLFTRNDKVLVVNGGSFGGRFKEICDIHSIQSDEIKLNYFEPLTEKDLVPFDNKGYTALLINVHETSTGVLYDMSLVKKFCEKNNLLLVVDAISSFLADPYDMNEYGINVTILSSQKALALPPGMSYIIIDSKAEERILNNKVNNLYFNLKKYLEDGKRGQTPYTPAVGNLIQLNKRLKMVTDKGVDNVIKEVSRLALDFRKQIKNLPLEVATNSLSNALTPIRVKGKMTANQIFTYLKDNHGIFVVPSGGELEDILFRVGHIGAINFDDSNKLISILNQMNEERIL